MTETLRKCFAACLVAALCFLLFSCGSVQTTKSGKPDTAKIEIVGDMDTYSRTVYVSVDGEKSFYADVNDIDKNKHKYQYAIPAGSHEITITQNGVVVVSKNIYASVGEVKVVELP